MKLSFCPKCSTTERPVCDSCAQELLDIYDKHNEATKKENEYTYTIYRLDTWDDDTWAEVIEAVEDVTATFDE